MKQDKKEALELLNTLLGIMEKATKREAHCKDSVDLLSRVEKEYLRLARAYANNEYGA
jgi:hypothetical protein